MGAPHLLGERLAEREERLRVACRSAISRTDGRHAPGSSAAGRALRQVHADPDGQPAPPAALPGFPAGCRPPCRRRAARRWAISGQAFGRPVTAPASSPAPARPRRTAQRRLGGPLGRITSVAAKLPCGHGPGRPRRPRPAVCRRARSMSGPEARRQPRGFGVGAVDLVKTTRPYPGRARPAIPAVSYWTSAAAACAAPSIPKRLMTPTTMIAADAISMPSAPAPCARRSSSRLGEPKYM